MNVKQALRNVAFAAVTLTALGFTVSNAVADADTPQTSTSVTLPMCELEDGSTQELCYWDGGQNNKGDRLVNVAYGNWTYNITTGEITEN